MAGRDRGDLAPSIAVGSVVDEGGRPTNHWPRDSMSLKCGGCVAKPAAPLRARKSSTAVRLRVMLDGIVLPALSNIDGVVPGDVYGVEIFY